MSGTDVRKEFDEAVNMTASELEKWLETDESQHRHLAQRPSGDVRETRWRYSLMNWGHDPCK